MTKMSLGPSRSEVNAILDPPGENAGEVSFTLLTVSLVKPDPSVLTT